MKLLGMSGSLRRASHDTAQLRGAAELAPAANAFAIHGLHELPRFDLAVEEQGGAEGRLHRRRRAAAGAAPRRCHRRATGRGAGSPSAELHRAGHAPFLITQA